MILVIKLRLIGLRLAKGKFSHDDIPPVKSKIWGEPIQMLAKVSSTILADKCLLMDSSRIALYL